MIFIIDIGNTNTKIACYSGVEYCFVCSVSNDSISEDIASIVNKFSDDLSRVVVACVGPRVVLNKLNAFFIDTFQIETEELTTKKEMFGIVNGYRDYRKLGVDRWLSILAASDYSDNTIIISAGTA